MNHDSKIFVAGSGGVAGSAIVRRLIGSGYRNLVCPTHRELDLTKLLGEGKAGIRISDRC